MRCRMVSDERLMDIGCTSDERLANVSQTVKVTMTEGPIANVVRKDPSRKVFQTNVVAKDVLCSLHYVTCSLYVFERLFVIKPFMFPTRSRRRPYRLAPTLSYEM